MWHNLTSQYTAPRPEYSRIQITECIWYDIWYDMTFSVFWTALLKAHHCIGWIDFKPYDQLSKSNETFNTIFSLPNIFINHFTDILLQLISLQCRNNDCTTGMSALSETMILWYCKEILWPNILTRCQNTYFDGSRHFEAPSDPEDECITVLYNTEHCLPHIPAYLYIHHIKFCHKLNLISYWACLQPLTQVSTSRATLWPECQWQ